MFWHQQRSLKKNVWDEFVINVLNRSRSRLFFPPGVVFSSDVHAGLTSSCFCSLRSRSGLSWSSSPPPWRSTAPPSPTSWTGIRGCCGAATTASTAPWTLGPTPRTCLPSATTCRPSSSWITHPGPTEPILVPYILFSYLGVLGLWS